MNTCNHCGKSLVSGMAYCTRCADAAVRARDNTDWKCTVCGQDVKQFHARYPISDPKTRSHVPAFFVGLCKSCNETLTFNNVGDVIKRKDKTK